MESDPDWQPFSGHTHSRRAAKRSKRDTADVDDRAAENSPLETEDGENRQPDTEEGENKVGESIQIKTEDGENSQPDIQGENEVGESIQIKMDDGENSQPDIQGENEVGESIQIKMDDGENSQPDIEEGENEVGENIQVETEDGENSQPVIEEGENEVGENIQVETEDGENSQPVIEEGENEVGESIQVETEGGTQDTSETEAQTSSRQRRGKKRKRHPSEQEALEKILQVNDCEQLSDEEESLSEEETGTDEEFEPKSDSSCYSSEFDDNMEEDVNFSDVEWKSKNQKITWFSTHAKTLRYFPASCVTAGPTHYAISRISSLKSSFELFMTDEIMKLVLHYTNLQGRRAIKQWKDISETELRAYIGLLILAGVYRSRNESTSSLWDEQNGRTIFQATMSHKKFSLISRVMRFDNKLTRAEFAQKDKLAAFRNIWDKWESRLRLLYNPGREVCVDEQMVPFKGRCRFRQYIPSKPAKYGIKIWVLCDVDTKYAWRMQIYTGKCVDSHREVNQGKRVVLEMTRGLKGHTVTCDNFFTSYELGQELLKRRMAMVGTVRKNSAELPLQLLQFKQRMMQTSVFAFTETHTAVSYVPKKGKNVLLLSTKHREPSVSSQDHKKPTIILDYNHCKGGVDTLNSLVATYSCRRRTLRWPMVLFYNMLDVSAYNALVLWSVVDPTWNRNKTNRRRVFLEQLGKALVAPLAERKQLIKLPTAVVMVKRLQVSVTDWRAPVESEEDLTGRPKKRGLCQSCSRSRSKVSTNCFRCKNFTCKAHTTIHCSHCLP